MKPERNLHINLVTMQVSREKLESGWKKGNDPRAKSDSKLVKILTPERNHFSPKYIYVAFPRKRDNLGRIEKPEIMPPTLYYAYKIPLLMRPKQTL